MTTSTAEAVRFLEEYPSHIIPINLVSSVVQRININAIDSIYIVNRRGHVSYSGAVDLGGSNHYFKSEPEALLFAYRKAKLLLTSYKRDCPGLRKAEKLVVDIRLYAETQHKPLPIKTFFHGRFL